MDQIPRIRVFLKILTQFIQTSKKERKVKQMNQSSILPMKSLVIPGSKTHSYSLSLSESPSFICFISPSAIPLKVDYLGLLSLSKLM